MRCGTWKRQRPVGCSERVAARNLLTNGKLELGISSERVRQPQPETERAWRMDLTHHVGRNR